tara:strand:- start:2209 stop:2418 length:210 start_codon:yes stop_codon:yes gene_type:complete
MPKDKDKTTYTYKLEICYDSSNDEVEYIEESLTKDEDVLFYEIDGFDIFDSWDEDSIAIIKECYEVGEA